MARAQAFMEEVVVELEARHEATGTYPETIDELVEAKVDPPRLIAIGWWSYKRWGDGFLITLDSELVSWAPDRYYTYRRRNDSPDWSSGD